MRIILAKAINKQIYKINFMVTSFLAYTIGNIIWDGAKSIKN